jgi:hypothetical protein
MVITVPPSPGISLSRPAEQRRALQVAAARVARLLVPASAAAGGYVSTQLRVALPDGAVVRPPVALARGDPPADGRLAAAPELVVVLGPSGRVETAAARWLAAGSRAVWWAGQGHAREYTAAGAAERAPGELLTVPGIPEIGLPTHVLLGGRSRRT